MSDVELNAANILAPHMGKVAVISIAASSARTNLAAAAQLDTAAEKGRFVTLQADGADVYCFFNNADSGTADETATSGNNRTFCLKAGVAYHFILRESYTWLVHKGAAVTTLRAYISSRNPAESS